MTWWTDANLEALYAREHIIEAVAIDADFPSGHLRLTSWLAGLTIGGNSYTSVAGIAGIEETDETTQLISEPRVYTLSGVDPSVVPESEIDDAWGRSWVEYLVGIDPDTHQVVGSEVNWEGYIAQIRRLDSLTPVIQVHVKHRLSGLDQSDGWRRTQQHQAEFFSGDTGYRHAEGMGRNELLWGGLRVAPGGGAGPGRGGRGGGPRENRD